MKRQILWMLAAILICGTSLTALCSCADEEDNSTPEPFQPMEELNGTWFVMKELQGKLLDKTYGYVGQAAEFNSDGTGVWYFFALDKQQEPVFVMGGKNRDFGQFHYVTAEDSTITITFDADKRQHSLEMRYQDGVVKVTLIPSVVLTNADAATRAAGDDHTVDMTPATTEQVWWISQMDAFEGLDDYNINDKTFTADNWRSQEYIAIFDNRGTDITDEKGRTGYSAIHLPWGKSSVVSNLPLDFCDDIYPANGWELVMNKCGNREYANNNYFALYNKYTGILRYFFYMPQDFTSGNDHVWQISMSRTLADRYDMNYGVPNDKTASDKSPFGLTASGNGWLDYVTPYVTDANDGLIVPMPGWWAVDVDLSVYRTDGADLSSEMIGTQMRSWTTAHISLQSALIASTDGSLEADFDLTKTCVKKSQGFFGKIGSIVKAGSNLYKTVKSVASGDLKGSLNNGVEFGKSAVNVKTAFTQKDETYVDTLAKGHLTGTINLSTTGEVDTEGIIQGASPTTGIIGPRLFVGSDFYSGTHLGQGVWNLKTSPVVYHTNAYNVNSTGVGRFDKDYWSYAFVTFLDPGSIEVELNPEVFPDDQIEWIQVDALNAARKELHWDGTDNCRNALSLAKRGSYDDHVHQIHLYQDMDKCSDFLYWSDDKLDMTYPINWGWTSLPDDCWWNPTMDRWEPKWIYTYGRGYDDYLLEPFPVCKGLFSGYGPDFTYVVTPSYEVNVTVVVKLRDLENPIVFNRIYLPEIKYLDVTNATERNTIYNRYRDMNGQNHQRFTDYNELQLKRMYEMFEIIRNRM